MIDHWLLIDNEQGKVVSEGSFKEMVAAAGAESIEEVPKKYSLTRPEHLSLDAQERAEELHGN